MISKLIFTLIDQPTNFVLQIDGQGTPGIGKSAFCSELKKRTEFLVRSWKDAKENHCYETYDEVGYISAQYQMRTAENWVCADFQAFLWTVLACRAT